MSGVYAVHQEDCSTPEVLGQRTKLRRRSLLWYVEQSVDWRVQVEVADCFLFCSTAGFVCMVC